MFTSSSVSSLFFFKDTATPHLYTLSLHDALPISGRFRRGRPARIQAGVVLSPMVRRAVDGEHLGIHPRRAPPDRKSTRLNSSHLGISYAVFCLKKKKKKNKKRNTK